MGLERLILMIETLQTAQISNAAADVYVMPMSAEQFVYAMQAAEQLRESLPAINVQLHCGGGNMKKQFKRADKVGAQVGIVIGDSEAASRSVAVKPLRNQGEQQTISLADMPTLVQQLLTV